MTRYPFADLPSPRDATDQFPVPARRPTAAWQTTGSHNAPDPGPAPAPGRRTSGGALRRGAATVLIAAAVAAGTVWGLDVAGIGAGSDPADETAKDATLRRDTGWQPLEVIGDWRVTGDGARYRVVDGVCFLQVHIRDPDGRWEANAPVARLPETVRPAWNMGFVATHDGVPYAEFTVFNDGQVLMVRPGADAGGWVTVSAAFPLGG
ncbi:hypothetical protein ACI797_01540 [Geodermatophilus sp. SYSU D00691]